MKRATQVSARFIYRLFLCKDGSALLITLAFVLLLTVLIVGFLSRVLLAHRISVSSSNQVKADVFAQGAEASIIGCLETEVTGTLNSTVPTWSPASPNIVYFPNAPANMVPQYDYPGAPTGTNTPVATVANLLKISTSSPATGSAFPAAAAAPTTTAALNGRSVTMSRWAESQMVDPTVYTNTATFPTPNWIMVARDGSNPASFSSAVTYSSANKSSNSTIIGRYAYMIYDEGGLLDMNVAGRPYTATTLPTKLTSYPMGEATADLTQLTTAATGTLMTTAQIDTLIGWRNNASVSPPAPTGTLTGPANLTAANATNYFNYLLGISNGHLTTGNSSVYNNGTTYTTDSAFTSRLQLIQFMQQLLGTSNGPAAMQFMTHFSRNLSQPSFCPPVNDPILAANGVTVPITTGTATYPDSSTNTASGNDKNINPAFLSVRVTSSFSGYNRNDGTPFIVGDPLVKKRFDLNRLAWVTYKGPIWSGSAYSVPTNYVNALKTNYGFTDAFLQQGTAANVFKYFGLSWIQDTGRIFPGSDNQYKWIYCHGPNGPYTARSTADSDASTVGYSIQLISKLTNREPDFYELLKAGIAAGSKAKAATWQHGYLDAANPVAYDPSPYQNYLDISLDNAIIQLGANIQDQFNLDDFPTRILYCDGRTYNPSGPTAVSNVDREFDGVENLPYFYRIRTVSVVGGAPVALTGTITDTNRISNSGYAVMMEMPEVWNPHDPDSPRCSYDSTGTVLLTDGTNPLCPTAFRLVIDSTDPDHLMPIGGTASTATTTYSYCNVSGDTFVNCSTGTNATTGSITDTYISNDFATAPYNMSSSTVASAPFTSQSQMTSQPFVHYSENSGMFFYVNENTTTNASNFFREPTMLCNYNTPNGSEVQPFGTDNIMATGTSSIANQPNLGTVLKPGGSVNYLAGIPDINTSGSSSATWTGIYISSLPMAWHITGTFTTIGASSGTLSSIYTPGTTQLTGTLVPAAFDNAINPVSGSTGPPRVRSLTIRMQYNNSPSATATSNAAANWVTYDTKYADVIETHDADMNYTLQGSNYSPLYSHYYNVAYDPRTCRFSMPYGGSQASSGGSGLPTYMAPAPGSNIYEKYSTAPNTYGWIDWANRALLSERPDYSLGYFLEFNGNGQEDGPDLYPQTLPGVGADEGSGTGTFGVEQLRSSSTQPPDWSLGWSINSLNSSLTPFGVFVQNFATFPTGGSAFTSYAYQIASTGTAVTPNPYYYPPNPTNSSTKAFYYSDPDHIVRRGSGSYMPGNGTGTLTIGQPMATAYTSGMGVAPSAQIQSRPIILHRPFKSVAELGYCFSGTPWKNIDFIHPESGDSALLDVFCIGEDNDPNGMEAGKVNLNTQQVPVLQAILAGTYKDEQFNYASPPKWALLPVSSSEANLIASALTQRTVRNNSNTGMGPLRNVAELVGRFVSAVHPAGDSTNYDGGLSFSGFSGDSALTSAFTDFTLSGTSTVTGNSGITSSTSAIPRMRESAIRALSAAGQTRVWNLMIDVIAQTGDYPSSAANFNQFSVQGEQRYWIHLAIDRLTGQIIDKQVEVLKE